MARPKQRTPELRDEVVRVAVRTLATAGVAGFTTRRVAQDASTSIPAVYEMFGDKGGLVRGLFFEGFRQLAELVDADLASDAPRADLERLIALLRTFVGDHADLAEVMFSRPFADFDPGPDELRAGASVRETIVARVQRCIDAQLLAGDATDISHVVLALTQGLARQELAGWLGTSTASIDRRWSVAVNALLDGFAPTDRL